MNSFLHINKRLIFFIGIVLISIFIIFIFSKQINLNKFEIKFSNENLSNIDILEPKFAINNLSKKINITANQGNFLNKDLNQMISVLKLKKLFLIEINRLHKVIQNLYLNQKKL